MRKHLLLTSLIVFLLVGLATVFTFAYFFKEETDTVDRTVGDIDVKADVYFMSGGQRYETVNKETTVGNFKLKVFAVNLSSFADTSHINNLRVSFKNESNIDVYFRVRIIDTLTINYIRADGKQIELTIPHSEPITYSIAADWYHDQSLDVYYYKNKLLPANSSIDFIVSGLSYPLMPKEYEIQFGIMIEAVQAHRGPIENWKLAEKPWGGAW